MSFRTYNLKSKKDRESTYVKQNQLKLRNMVRANMWSKKISTTYAIGTEYRGLIYKTFALTGGLALYVDKQTLYHVVHPKIQKTENLQEKW